MRYVPPSERRDTDWAAMAKVGATNNASDQASRVIAYLLTGPIAYGAIGWLVDQWLGTRIAVGIGALCGFGLSLYLVWLRYGMHEPQNQSAGTSAVGHGDTREPHVGTVDTGLDRTPSEENS